MTLKVPKVVYQFTDKLGIRKIWHRKIIPRVLAAMLLWQGEVTFSALGRSLVADRRNRSSVHRFFGCKGFASRDLYISAYQYMVGEEAEGDGERIWFLIIDGTSNKRGGSTKIENALKYKKKEKGNKGPSSKAHTFIMGLLLTDSGTRIPVPRRTWFTKAYCRKHGRKYVKMTTLMSLMIETVEVPEGVKLIVLADEFFEGKEIKEVCDRTNRIYICPVDSRRRFGTESKRAGATLFERGKSLAKKGLQTIVLRPGEEETAPFRRYVREGKSNKKRTYRATSEVRSVAGLGLVRIAYSWKTPVYDSRRDKSRESYKVLVSNGQHLSTRQMVEYYELRWQIEIFFRELKSGIGLCDYRGTSFEAFERFIDMILLAFLFLEHLRRRLMREVRAPVKRSNLRRARTSQMVRWLESMAAQDDLKYIAEAAETRGGIDELLDGIRRSLLCSI